MLKDDFSVIAYKILKYCDECLRNGVAPNILDAKTVCEVNETYFRVVLKELSDKGLIKIDILYPEHIRLTMEGAEYLDDNSKMRTIGESLVVTTTMMDTIRMTIRNALASA